VFDDESLAAQRLGKAPGKLGIVFNQQNADKSLLPSTGGF